MTSPNLFILYVKDPLASVDFYRDLLGREPLYAGPTFASFPLDGGFVLGLWKLSSVAPVPTATGSRAELAFMVEGEGGVAKRYKEWTDRSLPVAQNLTEMDSARPSWCLIPTVTG